MAAFRRAAEVPILVEGNQIIELAYEHSEHSFEQSSCVSNMYREMTTLQFLPLMPFPGLALRLRQKRANRDFAGRVAPDI